MATRPAPEPLITRNQITARVGELAARLSDDALASPPILLIVLKGSVYFGADLARAMTVPVEIEFIRANSYDGTSSTGGAKLSTEPAEPLTGRSVFIVEDILDTGVTASRLVEWVRSQRPASIHLVALLDKPAARKVDLVADYVGFSISNEFVVGYGLDYEQRYRELPDIHRLIHDG